MPWGSGGVTIMSSPNRETLGYAWPLEKRAATSWTFSFSSSASVSRMRVGSGIG